MRSRPARAQAASALFDGKRGLVAPVLDAEWMAERLNALVVVDVAGDQRQIVHQGGRGDHWIGAADRRPSSFERTVDDSRQPGFLCGELEYLERAKPSEVRIKLADAPGLLQTHGDLHQRDRRNREGTAARDTFLRTSRYSGVSPAEQLGKECPYQRACQSRHSELIALAGLHRVFADELDKLRLIGEAADKRERIDRLLWKLFRSAREQLTPLRGRKPSNRCE